MAIRWPLWGLEEHAALRRPPIWFGRARRRSLASCAAVLLGCLLGQVAGTSCSAQETAGLLTSEEVVRRYEMNRERLWPARITWTYTMASGPAIKANYRVQAAQLRKELAAKRDLSPRKRAELLLRAQDYERTAADPQGHAPTIILQDFWTDGRAFQKRIPTAPSVPPGWSFPDVVANEQTLLGELSELEIISAPDDPAKGVRTWAGDARKAVANVGLKPSPWLSGQLPPLALAALYDVDAGHPFDQFFAGPLAELAVVGKKTLDSIEALVVERREDASSDLAVLMTEAEKERYGNRLQLFRVRTAWVDPERGCLPLRMESTQRWLLDGRTILETPAFTTVSKVEIEQVAEGVWYPRSSTMTSYADQEPQNSTGISVTAIAEGNPPQPAKLGVWQTFDWKVQKVQPQIELAQNFFALPFPAGTLLLDHDRKYLTAVGDRSAVLDRMIVAPELVGDDPRRSSRMLWLIGGNVLLFALIVAAWKIGKRRRKSNSSDR